MMRTSEMRHTPAAEEPVKGGVDLQVYWSRLAGSRLLVRGVAVNGEPFMPFSGDILSRPAREAEASAASAKWAAIRGPDDPAISAAEFRHGLENLAASLQQLHDLPASGGRDGERAERRVQSLLAPGLVCVAEARGEHVYLIQGDGDELAARTSVVGPYRGETVEHVPPADIGWVLPGAAAVLAHHADLCSAADPAAWLGALLADLERWHQAASDLGRAEAYLLLALYDLLSYAIELVDYLPILLLEAEPERGKSRTGQAAAAVLRHGIWLQGIRESNLIRAAGDRQAGLFIDIMDVWKRLEKAECTDILLGRWERGGTVERVLYPDRGPFADTVSYPVFGPTIVATNEPIHRILDTRCLRIDMPLTTRRFSGRVRAEAARPLVERLMAWRAFVLRRGLPEMEPPADGRLGDILRPIRQVLLAVAPGREAAFDALVTWQTRRRLDDLAGSVEASIVRSILARSRDRRGDHLALTPVLEEINRDQPEQWQRSAKWLGSKVRAMGWKIERIAAHDKYTSMVWDGDLLERLAVRYGIADGAFAAAQTDQQRAACAARAADDGAVSLDGERSDASLPGAASAAAGADDGDAREVEEFVF